MNTDVYNSDMISRAMMAVHRMGLRGIMKSAYYSLRQTGRPSSVLVSKHVLTDVHSSATLDVPSSSRLLVGLGKTGITHPSLGKSKFSVAKTGNIRIRENATARIGSCSVVHVEGVFELGDSYLNADARLLCGEEITIGDGCALGWRLTLVDDDRHQLEVDGTSVDKTAPIRIGDEVWIGHDVTIKKGVTIGNGAVVASNSVVVDDVPSRTLVGGSPAELIAENVQWGTPGD